MLNKEIIKELLTMERVNVDLMYSNSMVNHKFYQQLVVDYYNACNKPHSKYYFIKQMVFGVSLCRMPLSQEQYLMSIEASARRNFKKCEKLGYYFSAIKYNDYIDEIWEIRRSAPIRQGKVDDSFLDTRPSECLNPKSKSHYHDYPYFGVFSKEGKLVAYAGCLVSGQLAMIEHILGHEQFLHDGVIPKLIIDIGKSLFIKYPSAIWYGYGTYFGAGQEMKRFKRKFNFLPFYVKWRL